MFERQLSTLVAAGLAHAVSQADPRQAYELIVSESRRAFGVDAVIVAHQGASWTPLAGARDAAFACSVNNPPITFHDDARVLLVSHADGVATAVLLSIEGDLALILDGDLADAADALEQWSLILAYALKAALADETAKRTDRLLMRGYAMARRLSRVGDADSVARRLVEDVAGLLGAERVSLALYREGEGHLTIAASHGYPAASLESVRIAPGEWVIGHVFATTRPVIVRDVRMLSGAMRADRYRSVSFAAVPVVAGNDTIGVLSVTDKHDGTGFERQDVIVLRALSVWAGIALASAQIEGEAARLAYAATIDSLTGLLNRPYLDSRLHQELERAKREGGTLAVMIGDIDDFKRINDRWGHQGGDEVLRAVGSVIRSAVRIFDVCARYGGDEFAIVMPNSDRLSAMACADRIRRRLADHYSAEEGDQPRVTMSIGVAVFGPGDTAADLIVRADHCMYQAKADGKNRIASQAEWPAEASDDPLDEFPVPDRLLETVLAPASPTPSESGEDGAPPADLPYVLVADAHDDRAAFCREALSGFQLGLLIARDGDQASRALEKFGPPALLIVDLDLPVKNGLALIETLRADQRRHPGILAWASSRAMREYASARLAGLGVRVMSDAASPAVIRAAIAHALAPEEIDVAAEPSSELDELRTRMADLSARARQICGTPGVAIYMRAAGDTKYHASFAWTLDDLMPHSPTHLPGAFEHISRSGESLVIRDVTLDEGCTASSAVHDGVRGLAGVPIFADREVVGAICVFDIKPLQVDEPTLAALRALGDDQFDARPMLMPPGPTSGFRDRASDRDPSINGLAGDSRLRITSVDWPPSLLERQGGEFAVARELARARREGHQLSVILFDVAPVESPLPAIDDASVEVVSETLLRAIRQSDLPIRWSSSELLVVLPGLSDQQARSVAERVRAALHAGARHRLAISGGVAELKTDERFGDVVDRARERVAMARGRGHNRVF
jgi:diguanylate cyclase (GGDEF)-like protein